MEEATLIKNEYRDELIQRLGESYNKLGIAFSYMEKENTSIKTEMREIQKRLKNLIDELQE